MSFSASPTLLAIEGSQPVCSVALLHHGKVYEKKHSQPRGHSQVLLSMTDSLLQAQGVQPEQLEAVLFSAGPGAFTGLRISLSLVQGLAFAWHLPVICISSLLTLAWSGHVAITNSACFTGSQPLVVPAVDARMGELYTAAYGFESSVITCLEDQLCTPQRLQQQLQHLSFDKAVGIGSGFATVEANTVDLAQFIAQPSVTILPDLMPQASALIALWQRYPAAFQLQQAMAVEPVYLRNTVAQPKMKQVV